MKKKRKLGFSNKKEEKIYAEFLSVLKQRILFFTSASSLSIYYNDMSYTLFIDLSLFALQVKSKILNYANTTKLNLSQISVEVYYFDVSTFTKFDISILLSDNLLRYNELQFNINVSRNIFHRNKSI